MIRQDPSVSLPVLFGVISIFVLILLIDEFKKGKNKD
jgi:hypothetical protein